MAKGDEILIVESNDTHRAGLEKLFDQAGYICTAVGHVVDARNRMTQKFFPVALVSLDIETPSDGIDLIRIIQDSSKQTAVILLVGRRSFEAAIEALRMGCFDVIVKAPENIKYIEERVSLACDRFRASSESDVSLLSEALTVLDLSFTTMLFLARQVYQNSPPGMVSSFNPKILLVDSQQELLMQLKELMEKKSWDISIAMTGGEALDKAGESSFSLVLVHEELPDLPGAMVLKSIQTRRTESIGLLYTNPGSQGRVDRFEEGKSEDTVRLLPDLQRLVLECENIINQISETHRDRRVIHLLRSEHDDFFRKYAELRSRIGRLLSR